MTMRIAVGLMSGTSMDGIDAALLRTDGVNLERFGSFVSRPYPDTLRQALQSVLGQEKAPPELVRLLTEAHADCVSELLQESTVSNSDVSVIGFHGHTVFHRPEHRLTVQIGDGDLLARLTGIDVVHDFRSADVAAGGQGAPFAPLYHAALATDLEKPLAVLNLGGVGNVTYIGKAGELLSFDTGPGNALIDDWMRRHGLGIQDTDGRLAATGIVQEGVLAAMLENAYFERLPPKSLDRTDFDLSGVEGLSAADGAATLTAFTAAAVARGTAFMPERPLRWLVTGGGRRNPVLMDRLRDALSADVQPVETVGWCGDALEAEAFAFLAVRSLEGLPLSLPTTTGVPEPMTGGRLCRAAGG